MALRAAGYEVVTANDRRDALEKANARRFGIVMTDLNMPVMSGLELVRARSTWDRDLAPSPRGHARPGSQFRLPPS